MKGNFNIMTEGVVASFAAKHQKQLLHTEHWYQERVLIMRLPKEQREEARRRLLAARKIEDEPTLYPH